MKSPLIFLSAGEASGDHYGAELITALRGVVPEARFTGLGGTAMETAGQQRVIRAEDVAVMGITEILAHIPKILHSYNTLVQSIKKQRPDVAVLIDFPDVNFRLAKHLKRMGVPVIWFVSPQLWAWKRKRLRWVQQRVAKMLTIFPFEQPFYANRGVDAEFVGHPLAEQPLSTISREDYATKHGLNPHKQWIALLPGSRGGEIDANLPELVAAAKLLKDDYEYLIPVAPTVSHQRRHHMRSVANLPAIHLVEDARAALMYSRAAVVASGTATIQAAVIGTPFVVVYRVSNLTFRMARALVQYPPEIPAEVDAHGNLPIGMVNLIARRRVVPELLQEQFTGANIAAALKPLLADTPQREEQIKALAEVRRRLLSPTSRTAMESLRDAVLEALP
ncbi:lipid-A-disaccharide synthase [Terriglobus sp. RCC_193]|uniref:lipid-A-disaccharide synthase n=1 Tax=Terriglobus sp. RCC_193 TaxID=3239218 RepID=UPI0035237935